jgi:hypothetical protein
MERRVLVILCGACIALSGCGDGGSNAGTGNLAGAGADDAAGAPLDWSTLEEGRNAGAAAVDAGGSTAPAEAPGSAGEAAPQVGDIVVENGVRYRAGPNDARVKVDEQGADITVDTPDADMPKGGGER